MISLSHHPFVGQEDRSGCILACIAMIAGRTYEQVRSLFLELNASPEGMTTEFRLKACGNGAGVMTSEAIHILSMYGFEVNCLFPDRIRAYLATIHLEYHQHAVVIWPDGSARDPNDAEIEHVSQLPPVVQLIPLIRTQEE